MKNVVIVAAQRTAIGSFGGVFKDTSAVELGTQVVKETLNRINLDPSLVDELIFGNVLSAGLGQNPARQVAIGAGLPISVPAFTVNHVCGSGLKAVILAAQSIFLGESDIVVCGGTENMTQAPFLLKNHRFGLKMGKEELIDSMIHDGLWDIFNDYHMGVTAENIASEYQISRDRQDVFALNSQKKAQEAIEKGYFDEEMIPIEVRTHKESLWINKDEYPRFDLKIEQLQRLRPAFKEKGTVSPGNSSGINDGAACLILMSEEKAHELNLSILGKISSFSNVGVDPRVMGIGPVRAIKKTLDKVNLDIKDIDLFELNEAFASQSIAVIDELGINVDKVNVNGGAIALGHPIGASGARILVSLLHEMKRRDVKRGIASLCIGGGQGISILIERT